MSKIRVLMCPTDRAPYITNIENSQRNMERIVGGPIRSTKLSHSLHIVLVHNAEGRIRDLPQNHSMPNPQIFGHAEGEYGIHGDCFLCGVIGYAGEEDFTDLPEPRSQWLQSAKGMWNTWKKVRGYRKRVEEIESKDDHTD